MWTAAILAGGQARRLGGLEKGALPVGARPIIDRQLAVLRDLTPHILIVARQDMRARVAEVPIVTDLVAEAGALGGLYTALMEAPTEQVIVLACDMPFVTADFLEHLATVGGDATPDAVVPRDRHGRHPLCASYRQRVAGHLKARIERGALRVLDALEELTVRDIGPEELAPYDPDGHLLLNVNTPEDYARALGR